MGTCAEFLVGNTFKGREASRVEAMFRGFKTFRRLQLRYQSAKRYPDTCLVFYARLSFAACIQLYGKGR
jgi:hypothetical protein